MTGRRTTGERPGSWREKLHLSFPILQMIIVETPSTSSVNIISFSIFSHLLLLTTSTLLPSVYTFLYITILIQLTLVHSASAPAMVRVLHIPPTAFLSASKAFPDDASWPGLSTLLIFQRMFTLSRVNKFHTLLRQINLLGVLTKPRALHALPNADCCCLYTRQKQNQRAATTASGRMPPAMAASGIKVPSCVL